MHDNEMGRKRQEKQRSEIRATEDGDQHLRDQQKNSRNIGRMEEPEGRDQSSDDIILR